MKRKPTKYAAAIYVENEWGEFTAVKRLENDESLPGVWGLPAGSLRSGEDFEAVAKRVAREKLGLEAKRVEFEGEMEIERENYNLKLREYRIVDFDGTAVLQEGDKYYAELAWQKDPKILCEGARKGGLCSRIFLKNRGIGWGAEEEK